MLPARGRRRAGGVRAARARGRHRRRYAARPVGRSSRTASRCARSTRSSSPVTSSSMSARRRRHATALGVPFLCAQKETTISPNTMREHAERVGRYAAADRRPHDGLQRATTSDSGCARAPIRRRSRSPASRASTCSVAPPSVRASADRRPTVLFLSYFVDAYHPSDGQGEPAWARMHRQTEASLLGARARGLATFRSSRIRSSQWASFARACATAAGLAVERARDAGRPARWTCVHCWWRPTSSWGFSPRRCSRR